MCPKRVAGCQGNKSSLQLHKTIRYYIVVKCFDWCILWPTLKRKPSWEKMLFWIKNPPKWPWQNQFGCVKILTYLKTHIFKQTETKKHKQMQHIFLLIQKLCCPSNLVLCIHKTSSFLMNERANDMHLSLSSQKAQEFLCHQFHNHNFHII